MIKARVLVPLNIRTGKPEILPDNNVGDRYYDVGDVVEIEESVIGENYKDINTWYKLSDGAFVWSGGVDIDKKKELTSFLQSFLKINGGEHTTIALLDTGVADRHSNLSDRIVRFNIANDSPISRKHGTRMAGLMIGKKNNTIVGFSPESTVYDFKIFRNDLIGTIQNLQTALDQIEKQPEVKIINLSLEIQDEEITEAEKQSLSAKIKTLVSKGKLVVAATGNNEQYVTFPGSDLNVITVGALKNNSALNFPNGVISGHTHKDPDCFIELYQWDYCDLTGIKEELKHNSSEATAVMSSLIALKTSLNKNLNQSDIKNAILKNRTLVETKQGINVYKLSIPKFLNF